MRTNSEAIVKEETLLLAGHKMGWMITIITPEGSMILINHLAFLGSYLETRKDSLQEGHILSMSSLPPVENHILKDNLPLLQKTEHSQKPIRMKRKPVSLLCSQSKITHST